MDRLVLRKRKVSGINVSLNPRIVNTAPRGAAVLKKDSFIFKLDLAVAASHACHHLGLLMINDTGYNK
jgi:hypothetical protein